MPRRSTSNKLIIRHLTGLAADTPDPERALARLTPWERQVLAMRFVDRPTGAEMARRRGFDQKALYRRMHRILAQLRRDLLAQGISRSGAMAA